MTIYYAAWELDSIDNIVGGGPTEDTTNKDTNFTNMSFYATTTKSGFISFTSLTDFWLHFTMHKITATVVANTNPIIEFNNGTSKEYRIIMNATTPTTVWDFQKTTNGTTWTTLVSFTTGAANTTYVSDNAWDIRIKANATTGLIRIYNQGTLVASYSGNTATQTSTVNRINFLASDALSRYNFAEIIVADTATINYRLKSLTASGAGTYSEWTGAYTEIDEVAKNDADFIVTNATNQRFVCDMADMTVGQLGSREVKAVVVASRQLFTTDAAPTNLQHMVRTNSADYFSANLSVPIDGSIYLRQTIWELNPSTSAKWTLVETQNMQVGVKSI